MKLFAELTDTVCIESDSELAANEVVSFKNPVYIIEYWFLFVLYIALFFCAEVHVCLIC